MKTRLTITVDKVVLNKFKKTCKSDGAKVSTKIEALMIAYTNKYKFNILRM